LPLNGHSPDNRFQKTLGNLDSAQLGPLGSGRKCAFRLPALSFDLGLARCCVVAAIEKKLNAAIESAVLSGRIQICALSGTDRAILRCTIGGGWLPACTSFLAK